MSAGAAVEEAAVSKVVQHYETLRTATLGGGLPLEARAGLALFLRRGMWGWAMAVAVHSTRVQPARSFLPTSTTKDEQQTIICRDGDEVHEE